MVFSSLTFLFLFMPLFFGAYFVVPRKFKNLALFIGGILFYAWGEPFYVFILCLSTFCDYFIGLIMHKNDDKPKIRKAALIASIVLNLSLLSLFRYSGFLSENINAIIGSDVFRVDLPFPIGISFYTFQTMSYTIDLYRRRIKVQKNPVNFAAFVTMFPQIVAGPIVRYEEVAKDLDERKINLDLMYDGICRFTLGLGKKVLIANNIGLLWEGIKNTADYSELSVITAWLGIIAFAFQIYFDFSGYSDMAIGLGKMLGFTFPENFNYPYSSQSISEFWRRWHITLGNWFKSYVYFPLGGSRHSSKWRTVFNLSVVWILTGIWHGASWNFVLWGVLFGVFVILEKLFLGHVLEKAPWFVGNIYVMFIVTVMWTLFDLPTLSDTISYLGAMFGVGWNRTFLDQRAAYLIMNYGIMFGICIIGSSEFPKLSVTALRQRFPIIVDYGTIATILAIVVACTAYLVNAGYNPFLYFNF
ncbi:MAG: MBOAT family protein [Oscillospiraceae bacterium]|nr:MBOAT family protein [Oscillospiraceae bacterium]